MYGSNSNAFIFNAATSADGRNLPLTGVTVTVTVNKSITKAAGTRGTGFQLNCWSELKPDGSQYDNTWQQFGIGFDENPNGPGFSVTSFVELWPSTARAKTLAGGPDSDLVFTANQPANFRHMLNTTVPDTAECVLTMTLLTDAHNNVSTVEFGVSNARYLVNVQKTVDLLHLVEDDPQNTPVTGRDLAPIAAMQLSWLGGTPLIAGAVTVDYASTSPAGVQILAASAGLPADADDFGLSTGESGNTWYTPPATNADGSISQAFGVSTYDSGAFLAAGTDAFTADQTNVFAVDSGGRLQWFYKQFGSTVLGQAAGLWSANPPMSADGFKAPSGAPLALSQPCGSSTVGVWVVDETGAINIFIGDAAQQWSPMVPPLTGPGAVPAGAPLAVAQRIGSGAWTDVFVVDGSSQIVEYSTAGGDSLGPHPVSDHSSGFSAMPGGWLAASQRFGTSAQTDVFVVDSTGAICVFSVVRPGDAWVGPARITGPAFAPPGAFLAAGQRAGAADQTDLYVVADTGALHCFSAIGGGHWTDVTVFPASPSRAGYAPPGAPLAVALQPGPRAEQLRAGFAQTDVFTVDSTGTLGDLSLAGADVWAAAPSPISSVGALSSVTKAFIAGAIQTNSPIQTDVFMMLPITGPVGPAWPSMWSNAGFGWAGPSAFVRDA